MKLKKWLAVVWLLATISPIIYFSLSMENQFDDFFYFTVVLNGLILFLTVSYLIYLFSTTYVPREKWMLWLVVLLFVNIVAMPFFWYWYVWSPLSSPSAFHTEPHPQQSKLVPILMGLGMFLIITVDTLIGAYSEGHSYPEIADTFPIANGDEHTAIGAGRISISKQKYATRTIWLGDVLDVSVSDKSIRFKPSAIMGLLYRSFEIPSSAVHSCSRQCGGSTDYILLLEKMDLQISIEKASEIIEWCWSNRLPILASSQRREWLYNGADFPDTSTLANTLENRSKYNYAAKQACLGY